MAAQQLTLIPITDTVCDTNEREKELKNMSETRCKKGRGWNRRKKVIQQSDLMILIIKPTYLAFLNIILANFLLKDDKEIPGFITVVSAFNILATNIFHVID